MSTGWPQADPAMFSVSRPEERLLSECERAPKGRTEPGGEQRHRQVRELLQRGACCGATGRTAEELVGKLVDMWRGPIDTLGKAGRALEGIEALLGGAAGGSFDLQVNTDALPPPPRPSFPPALIPPSAAAALSLSLPCLPICFCN